jgi:hypothetical protein
MALKAGIVGLPNIRIEIQSGYQVSDRFLPSLISIL